MNLPNDEPPPPQKKLRSASFAVHATRGVLRDQTMRRKAMFAITLVAVVLLFCGATFLAPALDPHARPGWFLFYWAVCAWITMTAVLLAIFDLLVVRAQGRAARRTLAQKYAEAAEGKDAD